MKRHLPQKILRIVLLLVGIPLASLLIAWYLLHYVQQKLRTPLVFGEYTIRTYGFRPFGLNGVQVDSVSVWQTDSLLIASNNITLTLHPFYTLQPNTPLFRVDAQQINLYIHTDSSSKSTPNKTTKSTPAELSFPEKLTLAFPFLVGVRKLSVHLGKDHYVAQDIRVYNSGQKNHLNLKARLPKAPYLEDVIHIELATDWSDGKNLMLHTSLKTGTSSLGLSVQSPLTAVNKIHGSLSINLPSIPLPPKVDLANLPLPQQTKVTGTFQGDLWNLDKITIQADIDFRTPSWEFLPALNWNLAANKTTQTWSLNTSALANGVRHILINALWQDSTLQAVGNIHDLNITLGTQVLPLDFVIHELSAKDLRDWSLAGSTGAGSKITARQLNSDSIQLEVFANPQEPWAVQWIQENIELQKAHAQGIFYKGELLADVSIHADRTFVVDGPEEFFTKMALNAQGIQFSNGYFYPKKEGMRHSFHGELDWHRLDGYYHFAVQQDSGGTAQVTGDFTGMVEANTHQILAHHTGLFFIDKIPKALYTPINAKYALAPDTLMGNGNIQTSVVIDGHPMYFDIEMEHTIESVGIPSASITYRENSFNLATAIDFSKPSDLFPELPFQIDFATIQSDSFDLALIPGFPQDSAYALAQGRLEYNRVSGFAGKVLIPHLVLPSLPEQLAQFSNIYFIGNKQNLEIGGRARLGEFRQWNNDWAVHLSSILTRNPQISAAVVLDQGGVAFTQGTITPTSIQSRFHVQGPFLLPGTIGEVDKSFITGQVHFGIKDSFNLKDLRFSIDTLVYVSSFAPKLFVQGSGVVEGNEVVLQNFRVSDSTGSALNVQGRYGLQSGEAHLDFEAANFPLTLDDFQVTLRELSGNVHLKQDLQVNILLPEVRIQANTPTIGRLDLLLTQNNLAYSLPLDQSRLQRNPRISGNIGLQSLDYRKVLIDLWSHLQFWRPRRARTHRTPEPVYRKPIDLDLTIAKVGRDTLAIHTDILQVPLTTQLHITGNTNAMTLSGDLLQVNQGTLSFLENRFTLTEFRARWNNDPFEQGNIALHARKEIPLCSEKNVEYPELCTINLLIDGDLNNLQFYPEAVCGSQGRLPPEEIFTSLITGCIEDINQEFTRARAVSRGATMALGLLLDNLENTTGINFGKVTFIQDENRESGTDSTFIQYVKEIPTWDSRIILTYSRGRSSLAESGSRDYDRSYESAFSWDPPFLNPKTYRSDGVRRIVTTDVKLTARQYYNSGLENPINNRMEYSVGTHYRKQFWEFCQLGLWSCYNE
jgi:hypothetical protein